MVGLGLFIVILDLPGGLWGRGGARVETVLGLIFHCHSCEKASLLPKLFVLFSLLLHWDQIYSTSPQHRAVIECPNVAPFVV